MQKSLCILLAALAMGVCGDRLMHPTLRHQLPAGLGFTTWTLLTIFTALAANLALRGRANFNWRAAGFMLPAGLAAIGYSVMDSRWLRGMDLWVIAISLSLSCYAIGTRDKRVFSGVCNTLFGTLGGVYLQVFGAIDLFCRDVKIGALIKDDYRPVVAGLLKGLAIATPLLVVFGGLFCAADQKFAYHLTHAIKLDFKETVIEGFIITGLAITAGGFLRSQSLLSNPEYVSDGSLSQSAFDGVRRFFGGGGRGGDATGRDVGGRDGDAAVRNTSSIATEPDARGDGAVRGSLDDAVRRYAIEDSSLAPPDLTTWRIGFIESATTLTLLNGLFLAFVVVQVRYLFGGASQINVAAGLSYAEYARHGFFELCTVASLVIPLLVIADAVCKRGTIKKELYFRFSAASLITLLMVIVSSALQRMQLYTLEYGLSELRFYTQGFMYFIACVCVFFVGTVLRGGEYARGNFVKYTWLTGLTMISALHAINPDGIIQTTNQHMARLQKYDVYYQLGLSADGISDMLDGLHSLAKEDQKIIAITLLTQREHAYKTDWRSANLSRALAWHAVEKHQKELTALKNDDRIILPTRRDYVNAGQY